MEKFKKNDSRSHGRGGKRKVPEESAKITSFFSKRTYESTPEILPVFDESSVDVDDPETVPTLISLASPSSEIQAPTTNPILNSSFGNSSLLRKKRYYREEWKIVNDDEMATKDRLQNLVIDAKDPWGMWCKACTRFAAELGGLKYVTNFVKDFSQFKPPRPKKETVNSHFTSQAHAKCSEKARVYMESSTSAPIYQKIIEINPQTLTKMKNIMRIVYYFAIKDRAGNEFSSECELQKLNGVDLGNTYQNNMSFTVLLKYVAMSFQNNIIDVLNKTNFFSVMTDGSTTKKGAEYEAVVIRHINFENLSISNSFIGLCKVENSNAAGLADVITKCLDGAGLVNWQEKLICMTVDGASVNVGKHGGLIKLIKSPVHIHCFNHVLDLCLKDSIKENVAATKAVTFVKTISTFYRTSPKLTRELFRAGKALEIKLISFKQVCDTRWADSLESVVTAVTRNYPAVVQHLTDIVSEHSAKYTSNVKSTAKGLLLDLTTYEVIRFFYAFSDFLSLFSNASKCLETADIDIVQSEDCITNLQIDLLKFGPFGELKSSVQKNLATFLATLDDSNVSVNTTFHNVILQKEKSKRNCGTNVKNHFKELCKRSSEIIKLRFTNNDETNSVVLRTSKILNTAYFPVTMKNFGESEITEFCQIFNIPTDEAIMEWRKFRDILSEHFRPEISLKDLHVKLKTNAFKKMQTIASIVEIILTIPPSNAEVERVWSSVSHTLDDQSLSMGKDTLEYRIQIKQSKIALDKFDPTSAINLWWSDSVRCRRPDFK